MKKIIFLVVICLWALTAFSQGDMKAKKYENPKWKYVVYVDFKEGKNERARTIIMDYFDKAAKKGGTSTPELALQMYSGEWDLMMVWEMKGGVEDLNWQISPEDVTWMKSLGEVAGGPDKAKALLEEWQGLISRSSSYLAKVF
jgi:hypothetical protein